MKRCLPFLSLIGLFAGGPALAQQFATPQDLVETLYDSYFNRTQIDDFSPYLSDALTGAMAGRKVGLDEFEALGFDPIVGDSDWQPRAFKLTLLSITGETAQVKVQFTSHDAPVSVTIDLVREAANGWQISHLAGQSGTRTWCTNDIVAAAR